MIGGGVTAVSALLICDFLTTGYSGFGCAAFFAIFSPLFPLIWLREEWGFFSLSAEMFATLGVIIWFAVGALIGLVIERLKSRSSREQQKSSP